MNYEIHFPPAVFTGDLGGFAIGCGAHRLWAHKSYDAKLPLRIFWAFLQTTAGQNCLYIWCRDHRTHHKYSDTDGDPHNTKRGYFFAHVGWLLRKKHPELKLKSSALDFSDLLADPVIKWQMDNYFPLYIIFAFTLPLVVPVYVWGDSWYMSFLFLIIRNLTTLHTTWFVNSTAHMFGDKPYNKKIAPVENIWVSITAFGEGFHNYHHTFPWDYSAAELSSLLNLNRRIIELTARIGLAYNLKRPSKELIESAKEKILAHHDQDNHSDPTFDPIHNHDVISGRGY